MKIEPKYKRKVKPEKVKLVLEKEGNPITYEQAVKVTDFLYRLAEILAEKDLLFEENKESL